MWKLTFCEKTVKKTYLLHFNNELYVICIGNFIPINFVIIKKIYIKMSPQFYLVFYIATKQYEIWLQLLQDMG